MPIKIDKIHAINSHYKQSAVLFKKRNSSEQHEQVKFNGNNVMKEGHFNPIHRMILNVIDAISPFLGRHPDLNKRIMKISEKIIKRSDSFKEHA